MNWTKFSGTVASSEFGDLTQYSDDRRRVLWILWSAKEHTDKAWLSPGEIETILRDEFGILVPRQRIPGLLKEGSVAARRRISGKYHYQIMQAGLSELKMAAELITFVDPEKALSHIRQIEGLLREQSGTVYVCDTYVDGRTLDLLAECSNAGELHLLTAKINKPQPFSRDLRAFRQEHATLPIEVRLAPAGKLHDRYIIDDTRMLIVGTSLNSFGRKQSFVVAAGEGIRQLVLAEFQKIWATSTPVS